MTETVAVTAPQLALLDLTTTLAAALTSDEVSQAALAPALATLGAVAGAMLLLCDRTLKVQTVQGSQAQTVWQSGPLASGMPAADAVLGRRALYFEHADALKAAYPRLEEQTGGVTAVATAVVPVLLGERALGVLILDFREPHEFTPGEQLFLTTLAAHTALALDRSRLFRQLGRSETVFRRLVEISPVAMGVGSPGGPPSLVNDAWLRLAGYTRADFEAGKVDWQAMTLPEHREEEQRLLEGALAQGAAVTYHKTQLNTKGERIPVEVTLSPFDDTQVMGYAVDLRPFQMQEQVLRSEQTRLEDLVTQRTAALGLEQLALQTFVTFMASASRIQDIDELGTLALDTLQVVIPGSSGVLYERRGELWRPRSWTPDLGTALLENLQRGVPLRTPVFAQTLDTREAVFIDGWREEEQAVTHTAQDHTVALTPVIQDEEVCAALSVALQTAATWTPTQRAVIRALGQSFSLLYDRISAARHLQRQRDEAQGRNRILEVLADLTTGTGQPQDDAALVQDVQRRVLELLPPGHAAYWEPEGELWCMRAHVNDVGNAELMDMMRAGLVRGQTPTLDRPWEGGQALYQDDYAGGSDVAQEMTEHVRAVAALPIGVGAARRGVINFTTFTPHRWSPSERALLETLAQGLWLALERLAAARTLRQQREEAERRSQALEAFAVMSRDLAGETDRYALVRRAQEIMLSLLTPGYALYWEAGEDRWHLKAQVGDIGDPTLQAFVDEFGLPLDAPALHSTWLTGVPNYQDNYAQGADTPAEMIRHVQAATAFRVQMHGQPLGMLAIGLFEQRSWTPMDRAALETAIYSLSLVLERAQGVMALAQSNAELQIANAELEAFTYSASHDLRTPVRHVRGFAELALTAHQRGQEDKVARHLEIVTGAADRMTAMIDAMLMLSRAGRVELQRRPVRLQDLVTQAQQDAGMEFPEQTVEWQIDPLPVVQADAASLQQVLTNLLSNAVKFALPGRPLRVRVWAQEQPQAWTVSVQDTGAGFDPKYADKLFGAFQRLHTQQQYGGTGVGLATVKRIISRHGGQVWAEGRVDEGATFAFTLPK